MLYYDKAKIVNENDVITIVMPSKKTGFFYIFSSIMAVLTPFHIIRTYRGLIYSSKFSFAYSIDILMLIGFAVFNVLIFLLFFWTCWGKEVIELKKEILTIKKTIFGLGYTKQIRTSNINSISMNQSPELGVFFVIKNGKISINTLEKNYNVGLGINDVNARNVILFLNKNIFISK